MNQSAVIIVRGLIPVSKQHGNKVNFKRLADHMAAKAEGVKGRRGSFWYLTQDYKDFKEKLAWEAKVQLIQQGWRMVTDWPVWLGLKIRANRNIMDQSNMIGTVEDALNGIAFLDDCQVFLDKSPGLLFSNMATEEYTIEIYLRTEADQSAECVNYVRDGLKRRGACIATRKRSADR